MSKTTSINRLTRRWPEVVGFLAFLGTTIAALILPIACNSLGSAKYVPTFNVALSVGTGGLVSFVFYYLVNYRTDRRRRDLLRSSVRASYTEAKWGIALAVIHASQKGGRNDLISSSSTIQLMLSVAGFRSLFEGGREGNEGYYAFMNQMDSRTPEFDEIIFNLRVLVRATERLIDSGAVDDQDTYDFFVRLGTTVERIERSGPGYDESKLLCSLIWEMFSGWSVNDGDRGHDLILRTIDKL